MELALFSLAHRRPPSYPQIDELGSFKNCQQLRVLDLSGNRFKTLAHIEGTAPRHADALGA